MNELQSAFAILQFHQVFILSVLQQTKPKLILELLTKIETWVRLNLLEDTQNASQSVLQAIGVVTSPKKYPAMFL